MEGSFTDELGEHRKWSWSSAWERQKRKINTGLCLCSCVFFSFCWGEIIRDAVAEPFFGGGIIRLFF